MRVIRVGRWRASEIPGPFHTHDDLPTKPPNRGKSEKFHAVTSPVKSDDAEVSLGVPFEFLRRHKSPARENCVIRRRIPNLIQKSWSLERRPHPTTRTSPRWTINRYYDPSTDEFLSIDPEVAETAQPYVFTNDDPLNAEDPSGNAWVDDGEQGLPTDIEFGVGAGEGTEPGPVGVANAGESVAGEASEDDGAPDRITGYTTHGLNQIEERDSGIGVSKVAVEEAVKDPIRVEKQPGGTYRFVGKDAVVVLNSEGEVVTAWARNSQGTSGAQR